MLLAGGADELFFERVHKIAQTAEFVTDRAIDAILHGKPDSVYGAALHDARLRRLSRRLEVEVQRKVPRFGSGRAGAKMLRLAAGLQQLSEVSIHQARTFQKCDADRGSYNEALEPIAIAASHTCRKVLRAIQRRDEILLRSVLDLEVVNASSEMAMDYAWRHSDTPSDAIEVQLRIRALRQIAGEAVAVAEKAREWVARAGEDEEDVSSAAFIA